MTADPIGGVWTHAMELSRGLQKEGIEVLLATMGGPLTRDQVNEAASIDTVEVRTSDFKLESMQDPWKDVDAAGKWLMELEQDFQPDVIHLNGFAHAALGWSSPCLVTAQSCMLSWWRAVKQEQIPVEWQEYRRRTTQGLQAADLVIAPTRSMLKSLESHYGALRNSEVIYNGRTPEMFRVTRKEPFILSAGRLWDAAKNVSTLASVARRLPWPVLVGGDNASPNGVEMQLGNVQLLGRLSARAMAALYSRAAIYALPARYEPSGLSVLEAALSRCALVLGDIPTLRELWDDAAIFVPSLDAIALEKVLLNLIGDPDRLNGMAERALVRARQLTSRRMSAAYLSAYASMLAPARAVAPAVESGETLAGTTLEAV